jgi:hypothetical protein
MQLVAHLSLVKLFLLIIKVFLNDVMKRLLLQYYPSEQLIQQFFCWLSYRNDTLNGTLAREWNVLIFVHVDTVDVNKNSTSIRTIKIAVENCSKPVLVTFFNGGKICNILYTTRTIMKYLADVLTDTGIVKFNFTNDYFFPSYSR